MSESIPSFEYAVSFLRGNGYTLVESTIVVVKLGKEYTINSVKVQGPRKNHIEIYDRKQYSEDSPNIGMFIDTSGMSYGDKAGNFRVSRLDDILDRL